MKADKVDMDEAKMNDQTTTIDEIKAKIKVFIDERDWEKFHQPKDVAICLSVEASEILDHFRFKSEEEIKDLLKNPETKQELADEIGDTFMFLADLARVCKIDLASAFEEKLAKSAKKYPIELVKGKNHKYTYYQKKQKK